MQERKFNSAFRVSSKQYDSLKMQNSLEQLLGAHSRRRISGCFQDSDMDITTPPTTSTFVRCNAGLHNASKDKTSSNNLGFKSSGENSTNSDFGQPQLGLFAKLRAALDELARKPQVQPENRVAHIFADQKKELNYQTPTITNDKDVGFLQAIITSLTQQPNNYLPPFALETLKDESNKQQQVFYSKLEQLRSLDQLARMAQPSVVSKTAASASLNFDNNKMDIQTKRESMELSSLNSLDEENEMHTKPPTQLNHLSISSTSHLEDVSLKTVKSETSSPTKLPGTQSIPDFSNSTLQQRLEVHHAKNTKCKASDDEASEGKGSSKPMGIYSLNERIRKILYYKKKIIKWRAAHPPNRSFSGRSAVAGSKPRIKGKFVKKEEYQKYMETQK